MRNYSIVVLCKEPSAIKRPKTYKFQPLVVNEINRKNVSGDHYGKILTVSRKLTKC